MKTTSLSPLLLLLALSSPGWCADAVPPPPPTPAATVGEGQAPAADAHLVLEFRGARLGEVLDYLSKEAGYVIVNPIELAAPLTLVSKRPLTPQEAVDALNGVLVDQGYAAIVRGRALRVVTLPAARQQNLPVVVGGDPARMPEGDAMITQVIPVSYAGAKDLAENLQPLLNTTYAVLSANESANILILTDTQSNVRRIASIVYAIDTSLAGEQQVRVFHLVHADADKIAQVLMTVYGKSATNSRGNQAQQGRFPGFPGGGRGGPGGNPGAPGAGSDSTRGGDMVAAADNGTNSLVVRAAPGSLTMLATVVEQLDIDTTGKDGVLLYSVRNAKAADLAKSLNDLFQGTQSGTTSATTQRPTGAQNRTAPAAGGGGGGAAAAARPATASGSDTSIDLSGQVRVVSEDTSNSVLVLTPERNFPRIQKLLEDMDRRMRQVLVRVLMAEVTLDESLDFGVELQGINPNIPGDPAAATQTRIFSAFNIFDSNLGANGYLLNSGQFRAMIRALATTNRFDVIARPSIITADNRLGTVNIGQNVPIINGTRTDQNNNVVSTFDRQDVGILLTVTPQINNDGHVVLDVSQTLSALADNGITIAPGVTSPIINSRLMTTRVEVGSGQTVVVGGLIEDSLTSQVQRVPLLGDIPLLGALFRRTVKTKSKTELLLFLTPQVIYNSDELPRISTQLRNETQQMDAGVEPGTLQRHLDQLSRLKVGEPLPVRPPGADVPPPAERLPAPAPGAPTDPRRPAGPDAAGGAGK